MVITLMIARCILHIIATFLGQHIKVLTAEIQHYFCQDINTQFFNKIKCCCSPKQIRLTTRTFISVYFSLHAMAAPLFFLPTDQVISKTIYTLIRSYTGIGHTTV